MSNDPTNQADLWDRIGPIATPTPETIAAARRTVAGHLIDPSAVGEVLDMLGIGATHA